MTLNENFQTLKSLSKADLNSVKEYLESLELNFNGFEDFLLTKKSEKGISCPHCNSFNIKKNGHKGLIQRFLCKDCHKTFTSRNHTITFSSKKSFSVWKKYIDCMMNGFTVRKSAEICGINKDTAFIWRHKILDALQNMQAEVTLEGIVEADEAFFPISYKGNHKKSVIFKMPRKAHKRGKQTHKRGLSREKVCVPCAVTRNGLSLAKITNLGRVSAKDIHHAFDKRIMPNSILCTDAISCYNDLARTEKLELIQLKTGKSKLGIYHIQHINSYHSMLKNFINRFHGVATKYLNNYLVWHNFLNYAKESYAEKTTIFADFVFTTNKVDLSKSIPLRPALPLIA